MSTDPGTIPPVPAQYGALDGTSPGAEAKERPRERGKLLRRGILRGAGAGPGPPTDPEGDLEDGPITANGRPTPADGGFPVSGPPASNGGGGGYTTGASGTGGYALPAAYGASPALRSPNGPGFPGGPGYPGGSGYAGGPNGPERTGPFGPPQRPEARRGVRDRIDDRREARANEIPDGSEIYQQRRFRRDKLRVVRGRRSRRIVRRIDTWTVLKVSLLFYLCALVVVLISGVVLWNVSQAFNFTHDIEKSVKTLFGYNTFTLHPKPMFEYTALGGAVLTIVGTLVNLLVAVTYNLIADVVGGIQIIVVTEDVN